MAMSYTISLLVVILCIYSQLQFANSLAIPKSNSCDTNLWLQYKQEFWKSYNNNKQEDFDRKKIFCKNLQFIKEFNDKNETGTKLAINHMFDWTDDELKSMEMNLTSFPRQKSSSTTAKQSKLMATLSAKNMTSDKIPAWVDYRLDPRVVGPVLDQGQCGSCWAFATTALIEAQLHKWNSSISEVTSLSPQQLVDCMPYYGCSGGWPDKALEYIKRSSGLMTLSDYPYISNLCKSEHNCHYKRNESLPTTELVDKFEILPAGDEEFLKRYVALNGPVISLMHSGYFFRVYDGHSVFSDPYSCVGESGKEINHAILIVGYGTTTEGQDYWIIKNSWSEQWGNRGFGLMARNADNHCEIATMPLALIV